MKKEATLFGTFVCNLHDFINIKLDSDIQIRHFNSIALWRL